MIFGIRLGRSGRFCSDDGMIGVEWMCIRRV
jgi:hypothetical protein